VDAAGAQGNPLDVGPRPLNPLNVGPCGAAFPRPAVFYGGAAFNASSRGFPSTPRHRLFKELSRFSNAVMVGERFTSRLCSRCETPLLKTRPREMQCPECGHIWNRDVNAAINIRHVGITRNQNAGVRNLPFMNENSNPPR
jgi:predicted RNA-binding Zn-ribbon protein involved in translation (DUF1610 family)